MVATTDLAILYKTETKRINEAVSRNSFKFLDRFCFKISEKEYNFLKSQIATSKGGSRKGHMAFTEEGVAMHSIFKDKRRATRDLDLDFIKYSLKLINTITILIMKYLKLL